MSEILQGDALELAKSLPDNSIHCIVTSPPYWGLRDYGTPGQLGLEETPEEYIDKLVTLFRELRRALHPSGTCWLNLGSSYNGSGGVGGEGKQHTNQGSVDRPDNRAGWSGLKPKDLIPIPWLVGIALQQDGWYLRSDIIWSKPNPMPESVTDRPTKAHEYIFLLTKSARYFYDQEAVREASLQPIGDPKLTGQHKANANGFTTNGTGKSTLGTNQGDAGRNRRTVWTVATQPYAEAHFATFPPKLIEPCILAGTSARGVCPECLAPWERGEQLRIGDSNPQTSGPMQRLKANGESASQYIKSRMGDASTTTTGWRPTCDHDHEPTPATVLDPFIGSGTTAEVAIKHGRNWLGFELNAEYIELAHKRLSKVQLAFTI